MLDLLWGLQAHSKRDITCWAGADPAKQLALRMYEPPHGVQTNGSRGSGTATATSKQPPSIKAGHLGQAHVFISAFSPAHQVCRATLSRMAKLQSYSGQTCCCVAECWLLASCHFLPLLHSLLCPPSRDIKPENILIIDECLKLADFGSCRGIYSKQPYTEYISTRWYRAPECLLTDGYYTQKMDMWGVGCVFFEVRVPNTQWGPVYMCGVN